MRYLILFDIDRTILEFKTYYSRDIFTKIFRDFFDLEISADKLSSFAGMTDLSILKEICMKTKYDYKLVLEKIDLIWESLYKQFEPFYKIEYMTLIPGIFELLMKLSKNDNFVLGLQTGNFKQSAYAKLRAYDLDKFFSFGAFGSDNEDRNELPELAIERANDYIGKKLFDSSNTLIVGDSLKDVECAKSNNLPIIVVNNNKINQSNYKSFSVDYALDDFTGCDFVNLIYKIFEKHNEKDKNCN